MKKKDCCAPRLYEAGEESWFPSHKRGEEKRKQIVEILRHEPNLSVGEIAGRTRLSIDQVRRHRRILISMGLWNISIVLAAFFAGAYYASPESIEEMIQENIENRILEIQEEITWNLQSDFIPMSHLNL